MTAKTDPIPRSRWEALCAGLSDPRMNRLHRESAQDDLYKWLVAVYGERHRCYHTMAHIQTGLNVLDQVGADAITKLAWWFHDAVYEPGSPDNEAHSAERWASFAGCFRGATSSGVLIEPEVARLILLTKDHQTQPWDRRGKHLVLADLHQLGSPWDGYWHNSLLIRKEYGAFTDAQWNEGRKAFLNKMLNDLRVEHVGDRSRYRQARRNMADERIVCMGGTLDP